MSGTSTGVLPSASQRARERSRTSARVSGPNASSTSSIRVTGLNTCSPTNRSGWPLACASSATDSDEVVVATISSGPVTDGQLGQQRPLVGRILDDRLDQEGRVGERRQIGGDPYSPRAAVEMLDLRAVLGDALLGARRRLIGAGPQQHVSVRRADGREPARDRARARDGESFLHCSPGFVVGLDDRAPRERPRDARSTSGRHMVRERSRREVRDPVDAQPSCSVGRTSTSLIAMCRGRVTMKLIVSAMSCDCSRSIWPNRCWICSRISGRLWLLQLGRDGSGLDQRHAYVPAGHLLAQRLRERPDAVLGEVVDA